MTDRAAVLAALDAVTDPKSGRGLAAAGLVQGLVVAEGRAGFVMEAPPHETALYAPVRDAAEAALKALPGMERVSVVLTAEAVAAAEALDELELADYETNFRRMFGNERMDAVLGSVDGSVRFFGLTPTSLKLEGLDRHQRLIDNYTKLHAARARAAKAAG